jgi:hypothetical protein
MKQKPTDYRNRIKALEDKVYSGERRSHKGWTVQRG